MSREPTFEATAIREQFSELASLIDSELTVYLIGGGALTLQDMKNATRDIDLIVREKSELQQLWNVLRDAGYHPQEDVAAEYNDLDAVFILEKDRRRFDVFHERVAGVLYLSDPMVSRSRHLFEEGNLSVRTVSLNDIFLFKAVANRDDDVADMIRIAQTGIDEDVIIEEIMTQIDLIGGDNFIDTMDQKLDRLSDQGFDFDIHHEVTALAQRVENGTKVRDAIVSLREHEYDDNLYAGVPESAISRRVGEETAESGIQWLVRLGAVERAEDDSLALTD